VHAVVAQVLQGSIPQDSDMPLTAMFAIVQLNHTESPKLHALITTKSSTDKFKHGKYYELNLTVPRPGTKDVYVSSEFLIAVFLMIYVFFDVTLCRLVSRF
jgi:hypothetical protein